MGRPQFLGNDVWTLDAFSNASDDHRGADIDRHAHAHDAPVFRLVQGYGMLSHGDQIIYSYITVPNSAEGGVNGT